MPGTGWVQDGTLQPARWVCAAVQALSWLTGSTRDGVLTASAAPAPLAMLAGASGWRVPEQLSQHGRRWRESASDLQIRSGVVHTGFTCGPQHGPSVGSAASLAGVMALPAAAVPGSAPSSAPCVLVLHKSATHTIKELVCTG